MVFFWNNYTQTLTPNKGVYVIHINSNSVLYLHLFRLPTTEIFEEAFNPTQNKYLRRRTKPIFETQFHNNRILQKLKLQTQKRRNPKALCFPSISPPSTPIYKKDAERFKDPNLQTPSSVNNETSEEGQGPESEA